MRRRLPRHTVIPLLLTAYLVVMAVLGIDGLRSGATSPLQYFGTIALTLAIIVALHFFMKKRERLRRRRLDDMEHNDNK